MTCTIGDIPQGLNLVEHFFVALFGVQNSGRCILPGKFDSAPTTVYKLKSILIPIYQWHVEPTAQIMNQALG